MKSILRRITALALCAVLLCSTALASDALGGKIYGYTLDNCDDTTLTREVMWSSSRSDLRTENYVTYKPSDSISPVVSFGSSIPDKQTVTSMAKALEKKVAFYHSPDLKQWTWMSDFGPMGDQERSWECPDLFQICVDGNPELKKWVLVVSVNWAREQYFVGDFDGEKFIPDQPNAAPLYLDEGLDY